MILVTNCLIYRELSQNVLDASGEVHIVLPSDTHLAVDHMAHGYSQPHPHTLNVVEVQVVQNRPTRARRRSALPRSRRLRAKQQNHWDHSF